MNLSKIVKSETFYLLLLSLFLFILFTYYSIISPGCEGGMDSYQHYLISRYSWKYPNLMLHQWGKPLYNILASPFANLGFLYVKIFNIILWLGSAWLTWATARKLNFKYPWFAFLLVIIPQVSIENVISGLTEFLNEFLLILFLYLVAYKNWNLSAFICGLLPFARSEGFVIMFVCGFYLLFIVKQYRSLIWFVAAPILFNIIGWIVTGDYFWIISNNPYIKAQMEALNLCGSGSLFHYLKLSNFIFSFIGIIFLSVATLLIVFINIRSRSKNSFTNQYMLWLVAGIFWSYFFIHSFIWWKGMMGSCGYTRVMIVITPLMALMASYLLNFTLTHLKKYFLVFKLAFLFLLMTSLIQSYKFIKSKFPMSISAEQTEFVKVAQWLNTVDYKNNMMYNLYAYLNVVCDIDPYDETHFMDLWSYDAKVAPIGSLIIWDAHFGPNECQLPLIELQNDKNLICIKSFVPDIPFKTLNDYPFEIHVFKKMKMDD